MNLIYEDVGDILHALYVPQEGYSSIYAESWADSKRIPCEVLNAEWAKHKRAAAAIRNGRIMTMATHFLIFGGPRSTKPLATAQALARKGRPVYYMAHGTRELEEITVEESDHKLCKGKGRSQPKAPGSEKRSASAR